MKRYERHKFLSTSGFTLAELAIVLLIVGLLLAGLLTPLATQVDLRRTAETQKTLEDVKDALLGFAAANGRLPCPAIAGTGTESPLGGVSCTSFYNGFVPGTTLGVSPVDNQGFVLDAWNNRIRYAVSADGTNSFTTVNGMKMTGLGALSPRIFVCDGIPAGGASTSCGGPPPNTLASRTPSVIFSVGPNGPNGNGPQEIYNLSNSNNAAPSVWFISHVRTPSSAPSGEFDDLVVWLSPNILYSRMIAAGQLP